MCVCHKIYRLQLWLYERHDEPWCCQVDLCVYIWFPVPRLHSLIDGHQSLLITAFTLFLAIGWKPDFLGCCICMNQVAAFDVALLYTSETMRLMCRAGKITHHVFLFLTMKNQMTSENAGQYLNMKDSGQNAVQDKAKRDTCHPSGCCPHI